jgi:hypothetical protein
VLEAIRVNKSIQLQSFVILALSYQGCDQPFARYGVTFLAAGMGPIKSKPRLIKTHQECKCIQAASLTITKQFLPCVSASKAVLVIIGELAEPLEVGLGLDPCKNSCFKDGDICFTDGLSQKARG